MQPPNTSPASAQCAQQFVAGVRERVGKIVVGQDVVVERVMIALLTGGHLLLQGLPGLAKTLLVNAVAKAINLDFKRVQFTVDMLPSDIIGSEIIDQKTGETVAMMDGGEITRRRTAAARAPGPVAVRAVRKRRELVITLTLDIAIAPAARAGLRSVLVNG